MAFKRRLNVLQRNYDGSHNEDVYIIGGSSIYNLFIPHADELLLTEIDAERHDADVYFPQFNREAYDYEVIKTSERNISYRHARYTKKER